MEENNTIDQEDKEFEEFKRVMDLLWFGLSCSMKQVII